MSQTPAVWKRWNDPLQLIQQDEPTRVGRLVLWVVCVLSLLLLVWSAFGKLDIVATAEGKLVPDSLVKVVQPAEAGVVKALLVREGDTVARLGGDEFVLLVQQLDEDLETAVAQAGRIGDKVVAQLSQPCAIGAVQYQGSASVGVSMFLGHALDLDEILKRADLAMYQAKAAGRNTVRFSIRRSRRASMPAPHWKRTCARPYNATSWCCTTSPRWTPRAAVWVWRPWCAGNTRSAGRCSRWTSFRWPRRRG